jgi:hypothetical protein
LAVTQDKSAPYAPSSAIMGVIERYRSRGLPLPVNADALARIGVSGSLIPRTLQALQTLDLVDDAGAPTATLEGIRLAPEAEYKKRLEDWLKGAYPDVFSIVDPGADNETNIRDAFRTYQPMGQQERMVTLFQGLCSAAGLIPEKVAAPRRVNSIPRAAAPRVSSFPSRRPPPSSSSTSRSSSPPPPSGASLPPALNGLLASIPTTDRGWTQAQRDKFYATFGTVLDFSIPIKTEQELNENGGQE